MTPDDTQAHDDDLSPSMDQTALNNPSEPGDTNVTKDVPQDLIDAGYDTNEPRDDSPESLDEEIKQGANREDIDPQHTIDRPAIDNIDEEEHGVN